MGEQVYVNLDVLKNQCMWLGVDGRVELWKIIIVGVQDCKKIVERKCDRQGE